MVASAVIFFGALISMGNERQRKAIDDLREQVVLWAIQDLKIKREHLARTVEVPDPLKWLNTVASKACSYNLKLQVIEVFDEPRSLVCTSGDESIKFVFSLLSPTDLRQTKYVSNSRLSQFARHNPLLLLPKSVEANEISVLNSGYLFDLELTLAWKALTGQDLELSNRLWMYKYS